MAIQAVSILSRKNDAFPARLQVLADGSIIQIDAVERCWTEVMPNRNVTSYIFRVRSGSQRYKLSENVASGQCLLFQEG